MGPTVPEPLRLRAQSDGQIVRPRVLRLPADWWDPPSAVGCKLSRAPQATRPACRLTRNTLREWGLTSLVKSGEIIVGELVANAIHETAALPSRGPAGESL
jgi:hypothetical protein